MTDMPSLDSRRLIYLLNRLYNCDAYLELCVAKNIDPCFQTKYAWENKLPIFDVKIAEPVGVILTHICNYVKDFMWESCTDPTLTNYVTLNQTFIDNLIQHGFCLLFQDDLVQLPTGEIAARPNSIKIVKA